MNNERIKEVITLRGICASLQAMATPTIQNLKDLFKQVGYKVTVEKEN